MPLLSAVSKVTTVPRTVGDSIVVTQVTGTRRQVALRISVSPGVDTCIFLVTMLRHAVSPLHHYGPIAMQQPQDQQYAASVRIGSSVRAARVAHL